MKTIQGGKAWTLVGLCLTCHLALGLAFIRRAGPTFDEGVHLASGYTYLATGKPHLNILVHPPLGKLPAALPLLYWRPKLFLDEPAWIRGWAFHYADLFLFHNSVAPGTMLGAARAAALLFWSALLAAFLLPWATRLGGPAAAAGTAFALAFQPVLTSNFSLVGTDAAPTVFYCLTFFLLSRERRTPGLWLAAGLAMGLGLASKFSMILLPPLAVGLLAAERRFQPRRSEAFPWRGLLLACTGALFPLIAAYGWRLPLFWEGVRTTLADAALGRMAYLNGRLSESGFWTYYPAALLFKTPLALLLLGLWAGGVWLRSLSRERFWVLAPLGAYLLAALLSKVQVGVRHLLPALPLLALLCGWALAEWTKKPSARLLLAWALCAWTVVCVLRVQPHALAYFNELAGGPSNGWRRLGDSNLDWGQDLPGLAQELRRLGDPPVYLSYFGTADPAAYGIRYTPTAMTGIVERAGNAENPAASGRVLLAVSATNRQGIYLEDPATFSWLDERTPIRVIGYSLFLYELTYDADGRARLAKLMKHHKL